MKKVSFSGFLENKALLVVVVLGVVFGLGSVAFMSLNGVAHSSSTEIVEPIPESLAVPAVSLPTQAPTQEVPTPAIEKTSSESEIQAVEDQPSTGPFPVILESTCIPDKTDYVVASVIEALDTDQLSVSIEGEFYTIKFLGVDTHPTNDVITELVLSANEILVGKEVALVADKEDSDDDGNLLRYVFTEDTFINLALIERGLAQLSDTAPVDACGSIFEQAQRTAKDREVGAWERLKPKDWREWPVIPVISKNALDIYLNGLAMGTDPNMFTIVGDCQNIPGGSLFRRVSWDDFTLPPELEYLQPTVEHFSMIWSREPVTVDGGFIPASMFSSYWTDAERCDPIETPLECEFRLNKASIVLIGLGSDQKPGTGEDFDYYMRKIVEFSIEKGALPIIATDAYPTEEGFPLNQIVAQIAYEYDIPLWNFWAAVQDLSNQGLKADNFHISAEAFSVRRLTGLQVLHAVLDAAQQYQE